MWPFKKKKIVEEILSPVEIRPEEYRCIAKCIIKDLKTLPQEEWKISIVYGIISSYRCFSHKNLKYRLSANLYKTFANSVSLVTANGDNDNVFTHQEKHEIFEILKQINKIDEERRELFKKQQEFFRLRNTFPQCLKR